MRKTIIYAIIGGVIGFTLPFTSGKGEFIGPFTLQHYVITIMTIIIAIIVSKWP